MTLLEYFKKNYEPIKRRKNKSLHVDFHHEAFKSLDKVKFEMIQADKRTEILIEVGKLMGICANWINHYTDKPDEVIKHVLNK